MKRIFDIVSALIVLCIGLPFFILIGVAIKIDSTGPVFFVQERIGKERIPFGLLKFRTMRTNAEQQGQLTIGGRDARITTIGYYLRKFKIDEFPQLINVLKGEMSIVGPRPEVKKYVDLYSEEELKVLTVKPGLTDLASLLFINENEILGKSNDPEKEYISSIMPQKLQLNLEYIRNQSILYDFSLIFKTLFKIIK